MVSYGCYFGLGNKNPNSYPLIDIERDSIDCHSKSN